jgi:hypothetical protein
MLGLPRQTRQLFTTLLPMSRGSLAQNNIVQNGTERAGCPRSRFRHLGQHADRLGLDHCLLCIAFSNSMAMT